MRLVKTYGDLEKLMNERIKDALQHEVADYVKGRMIAEEQKTVMSSYTPKMYERREDGMGNVENITHSVRKGVLKVHDETPLEGPRIDGYTQTTPYALAQIVEEGARNPWNGRRYRWTKPRPVVANTQNYINSHPEKIKRLIKAKFK